MSDQDSRCAPRKRVLKGAIIVHGRNSPLPCAVRNISDTRALLEFAPGSAIIAPDQFHLIVDLDGIDVTCRPVWRRGDSIGVEFEAPLSRKAPKRVQVIAPVVPAPKPSLRKKPNIASH